MKLVLLVGLDPATVDFSDPALPPRMTAEKIHAIRRTAPQTVIAFNTRPEDSGAAAAHWIRD